MNLLINDLSGIGKVALSPMTTIINCAGLEIASLPTTILSSHTGHFENVFRDDYSRGITGFVNQWQGLDLSFDSFITGYFCSAEQIERLLAFKSLPMNQHAKLIVDPVMADNGKLYKNFTDEHVKAMRKLTAEADLILPNFTEACLLTELNISEVNTTPTELKQLTLALNNNGQRSVVITGIKQAKKIVICGFDTENNEFFILEQEKLDYNFVGTGDILTAIVSSCYLQGIALKTAVQLAIDWLLPCLKTTINLERELIYGVYFEAFLADLIKAINDAKKQ